MPYTQPLYIVLAVIMAQYRQKYRKAMKDVSKWMADDLPPDELHSADSVRIAVGDDTAEGSDGTDSDMMHKKCCEVSDCIDSDDNGFISENEQLTSSDSCDEQESNDFDIVGTLQADLAEFMTSEHLSRNACNRLLALFRKHGHSELPKDSRTLRKTPRVVNVLNKCGGQYIYFGIRKCLEMAESCDLFELTVNVDGIPIYKSSSLQFWPILCKINSMQPVIIALYMGSSKPTSADEFLADFVDEMEQLQCGGFVGSNGEVTPVILRAFVCDAPARAFVKNIKSHTSLNACERCIAVGKSVHNRTVFNTSDCFSADKRCAEKFANLEYLDHQLGPSALLRVTPNCVNVCPLEYMHCVCLGAVRRMLQFWKRGDRIVRLSNAQILQISEKLIEVRDFIPSEFARRPRSLIELDRWKATEFRQFLLYTGPVVLKSVLQPELYKHFLCLSISIGIMLTDNSDKRERLLDYAGQLIRHFVVSCERLYGSDFVVYNIHSLLHIFDDAVFFKCSLDQISSFPFENYLQTVKRLLRSPSNPIVQVVKRIQEFEAAKCPLTSTAAKQPMKLTTKVRDSLVLLKNGKYAEIVSEKDDVLVCEIYRRSLLQLFFTEPCSSDLLDIFLHLGDLETQLPAK